MLWITRSLERAGFETWAVGGAVRDVLLDVPSVDWDLATRARPEQVRRLFRRTIPLGIEHGTVGILARDGTLYEVTTFRRDVRPFGRRSAVEFADTLEEDLSRRDFTINAVAWHPLTDVLFDPFGGLADLESGILRTVGEPDRRFAEDYLRVLRALRFAGRYDLEIDPPTWRALREAVSFLGRLSRERVREELLKVLSADPDPGRSLSLYQASGALAATMSELAATEGVPLPKGPVSLDVWSYGVGMARAVPRHRPLLRLGGLMQGIGLPDGVGAEGGIGDDRSPGPVDAGKADRALWRATSAGHRGAALLARLRFSNADVERVTSLLRAGPVPPELAGGADLRRWLARVGAGRLRDLTRLWAARARVLGKDDPGEASRVARVWRTLRQTLRQRPPLTLADLALGGRDLIRLGMKPSPAFGQILEALLEQVLEDPSLNERGLLQDIVLSDMDAFASPPVRQGGE